MRDSITNTLQTQLIAKTKFKKLDYEICKNELS